MAIKQRLTYLDILKFIGMLFIYVGHFLDNSGWLYRFVFAFHVPLFFFLSGCTENFNKETNILKGIIKKIKTILVPFYFFAFSAIVFKTLIYGDGLGQIQDDLAVLAKGCVRNEYFASSLWFLTCLFVVGVVFQFIKKLKNPLLMVLVSTVFFLVFSTNKFKIPEFYNLNSAAYYLLYYCLGYVLFNGIDRLLTSEKIGFKIAKYVSGVIAFCFTGLLFFQKNLLIQLNGVPFVKYFFPVLTALIPIWFFFLVAYALRNYAYLADLGRSSLYFCGSEYIVKHSVYSFMVAFFGFSIRNGFVALVYSFILLALQHKFIVPILAKMINYINSQIDQFFLLFKKEKNHS